MHQRVVEELERLKMRFPEIKSGDQLNWFLIPLFPLPEGRFEQADTPLLVVIPPGYPNTGPDNFFVRQDLRLKGGGSAAAFNANNNSSSGPAPMPGDWGWFSWHPQAWRPVASIEEGDNLETYLRGVSMCLRGEETP
jgi:hypothetical protein